MSVKRWASSLVVTLVSSLALLAAPSAARASVPQSGVPSVAVSSATPDVGDGTVYAIAKVGDRVFLGGDFTNATSRGSSTATARANLLSFDSATGVLDPAFAPQLDGEVDAIIEGPANTVYVAGAFKTVNGKNMRVARLNAATGALVSSWKPKAFSAATTTLALSGGVLYVGGVFTKVAGVAHQGLVALDPTTGAVLPWFQIDTSGRHGKGTAIGGKGAKAIKVNPAGTQMVVIGNFVTVTDALGSVDRDQAFLVDLGPGTASIDRDWRTLKFTAQCYNHAFDSTVRDVDYSPDGSYFVIASTGGGGGTGNTDGSKSLCDSAARFESDGAGTNVVPTWVSYAGGDSLWSVAVTGSAVYAGGHQRWANNANGNDVAGAGAVPRPGLVALDPQNGLPLTWNPGRNPRGAGAFALLATSDGLYVGSDTSWIGNFQWRRERIAFFPLAGGSALPSNQVGRLPGTVYLAGGLTTGADTLQSRTLDGAGVVGATVAADSSMAWSQVRGAFLVDDRLFYGLSNGTFNVRSFGDGVLGPQTDVNPYLDPFWSDVPTGSGSSVYRGRVPDLYGSKMTTVTAMFYSSGRMFYTLSGQTAMRWRYFTPESGIMGPTEFVVSDGRNWSTVAGAFVTGGSLYYVNKTDGVLRKTGWTGTAATGLAEVVNSTQNWSTRGLVLRTAPPANQLPTAAFTSSCVELTCSFDGSTSSDPDGAVASWTWDFGPGADSGAQVSHTFATPGDHPVSLTVVDSRGGANTVVSSVHVEAGPEMVTPIEFVASSGVSANSNTPSIQVPATVQEGDTLLLTAAIGGTPTVTDPAGWTPVNAVGASNLDSRVWTRVATAADAGSSVTVTMAARHKAAIAVSAYRGAGSVASALTVVDGASTTHTAPTVTVPSGSWVVWFWAERGNSTSSATPSAGVEKRQEVYSTGSGRVSALVGDTGTAGAGVVDGPVATTDAPSTSAVNWSIVLGPQTP